MKISSGSPKFETPSAALFINSPHNSNGSFDKSSHCSLVNKYPKKQDGAMTVYILYRFFAAGIGCVRRGVLIN